MADIDRMREALSDESFSDNSNASNSSGGCFVGVVALASSVFPTVGVLGMMKWYALEPAARQLNAYFWTMLLAILVGGGITLMVGYLAWKMMQR